MSFISIIKKIGTVGLGIEHLASPILAATVPGFAAIDAIVQRVQAAILTIEATSPMDGQGKIKSDATVADFNAALDIAQQVAAARGKRLEYDAAALQAAINAQVEAYNNFAKLKASFHEVDLPPKEQPK